jgi:GNAT superfamily N-acetyltransferase
LHFAEQFADFVVTAYGILYYNDDNPNSWDSNHAIFTNPDYPLESAITDIIAFYMNKGITPRIYASLQTGELDRLRPHLEKYHFQISYENANRYFLWQNPSIIKPMLEIRCERVLELTPDLKEIIYSDVDGGEWTIKVLQRHLKSPDFHLLQGSVENKAVTLASVKMMNGYSRVDDVITHQKMQGRGYNSALMHYLVNYHQAKSDNFLYLYASSPRAIHIYQKAGFVELPLQLDNWAAFQETTI